MKNLNENYLQGIIDARVEEFERHDDLSEELNMDWNFIKLSATSIKVNVDFCCNHYEKLVRIGTWEHKAEFEDRYDYDNDYFIVSLSEPISKFAEYVDEILERLSLINFD